MKKLILMMLAGLFAFSNASAQQIIEATPETFDEAVSTWRKAVKKQKEDVEIRLKGGTYFFAEPLVIDEAMGGKNGKSVKLTAVKGEKVVISGGVKIEGWERVHGNLFKAPFNHDKKLRTLIVGGKRARMAGMNTPAPALGSYGEMEITGEEPWAFGAGTTPLGIRFEQSKEIMPYRNPEDVELIQNNVWTEKILCAADVHKWGNEIAIELQQPYSAILNSLAWAGKTKFEGTFLIRNAFELLDEPGEFYFDRAEKTIYYISDGEDITKQEVIAPMTEGLIRIKGSSCSSNVENVTIENLTFSYDAWNLVELEGSHGFGGIQSLGMAMKYIPDGNWHPTKYNSVDVPEGTIQIENAEGIRIIRNHFLHLGAAATVNMANDVTRSEVIGNYFNDCLGNAVAVGHPQHYEIGDGDKGAVYAPGIEGLCQDIDISNNMIRNVSLDFRQVEGIVGFFCKNVKIDHNDIYGTPYGAIALGWWWGNAKIPESTTSGNNSMSYNRCGHTHTMLTDGGIIYMLGRQPGSVARRNYLFDGPRCIYPDDGSSGWLIEENFVVSLFQLWMHIDSDRNYDILIRNNHVKDNRLCNSGNGTIIEGTKVYRNIPFGDAALQIQDESGLEPEYHNMMPEGEVEPIMVIPTVGAKRKAAF
ncbi:MAG: hypothetical protein Q4A18_00455 [Rikenellaceae bacterium]|nr:hypothetical protein [Rikenellaceae bacterium]